MSEAIRPFKIEVPDAVLEDLQARLARTRWPDQIPGTGWEYGSELAYVQQLCESWRSSYDWRKHEAALNRWPQFTTAIDGQRLHFVHAKSKHASAFPLIITHGWPGSVVEFQKLLPLLVDPTAHGGDAADAFHVVCPSLPGYGWSGPTQERGWDPERIGRAEVELMRRLGHARYGAQGGDWGSLVTAWIARLDPAHCAGIHLNMLIAPPPPDARPEALATDEQQRLAHAAAFQGEGTGYQAIQGTKPQTLAYGLSDSPAGLAAWIVEKFRAWGDCRGDVESVFTRDELLTNLTLYWVTGTINSSTRLYYEMRKSGKLPISEGRIEVPTGVAVFPKELYNAPRAWAEGHYNITHWSVFPAGGHFAAMEQPAELAADLRKFFRTVR
ncbi:MAG: epoxide hydrolase family protein [Myxococcota bacterium]